MNSACSEAFQVESSCSFPNSKRLSDYLAEDPFFLKSGDVFLVKKNQSKPSIFRKKCIDEYDHSGIILDEVGNVFEVSNHINRNNLLIKYINKYALISRYVEMDDEIFNMGFNSVKKYGGKGYPNIRKFFSIFGISNYINWNKLTPDELVAKFIHNAVKVDQIFDFEEFLGFNTKDLYNILNEHENFNIIYEGKIL